MIAHFPIVLTGELRVQSLPSKIKETVVHAGPFPSLALWKELIRLNLVNSCPSLNSNSLTVTSQKIQVAMVENKKLLSNTLRTTSPLLNPSTPTKKKTTNASMTKSKTLESQPLLITMSNLRASANSKPQLLKALYLYLLMLKAQDSAITRKVFSTMFL